MMSRLGVVLVLMGVVSASASAEEGAVEAADASMARRNVVSLELPFQARRIAVTAERVLSPRVSVGLGVLVGYRYSQWREDLDETIGLGSSGNNYTQASVGLAPGARFFLTGAAPEGLWVSPQFEVSRGWLRNRMVLGDRMGEPMKGRQWVVGGTGLVGYSVVMEPGLVVQGGVGLGARYIDDTSSRGGMLSPDGSGSVLPETRHTSWDVSEVMSVSVGWAF